MIAYYLVFGTMLRLLLRILSRYKVYVFFLFLARIRYVNVP